MTRFLLSASLLLSLAACGPGQAVTCNVAEAALLGDWERSGDAGAFEQFSLGMDGTDRRFDSWLHERPEVSGGSWTFQEADCRLAINGGDSNLQWHFKVATDKAGAQLTLSPLDAGSGTVDGNYRRLSD